MNWVDSIKEIVKANNENRLVIFVGAGVSKNSNIPDWKGLIKNIANTINYHEKCNKCNEQSKACPKDDCEKQYDFSREEYLKIPEYYFHKISGTEKAQYYQTIVDTIKCDAKPNAIDDLIFDILPQHIITTNYDTLLEDSNSINTSLYKVIYKDRDLLSNVSDRYLIKMHGDINDPSSIILKESDYIDYEQTHTLISTFIKSLLINSTFLFLGYSLNDNNLNLIIGWINYYCKLYGVNQRPHNFLIQNDITSQFEQLRLDKNNIHVIYIGEIPNDISCPDSITDNTGKNLFRFLKCISDSKTFSKFIPLHEILKEKYEPLSSYKKIAQSDLLASFELGRYQRFRNELLFWDKEAYDSLVSVLNEKISIATVFNKANIVRIHLHGNDKQSNQSFDIPQHLSTPLFDSYFHMYLDNRYSELLSSIESMNISEKIYYSKLLNTKCDMADLITKEAEEISKNDFIGGLLHRVRARLATLSLVNRQEQLTKEINAIIDRVNPIYANATCFIKHLTQSTGEEEKTMIDLLEKHKQRYSDTNTWYSGCSFEEIWKLQAYVYDYYEFFIINLLPLNYYSDPVKYFSSYVESIFCSYSPTKEHADEDFMQPDLRPYPINEIDLDIIIKYTDTKFLKKVIKRYGVKKLLFYNIDIVTKFVNYCNSSAKINVSHWSRMFSNFVILLSLCQLEESQIKDIYSSFATLFIERGHLIAQEASNELIIIIKLFSNRGNHTIDSQILHTLLSEKIKNIFLNSYKGVYCKLLFLLKSSISGEDLQILMDDINSEKDIKKKCEKIHLYRALIPIQKYSKFLSTNILEISAQMLFDFIIEQVIPFDSTISETFINEVKHLAEKRTDGLYTYPDYLTRTIENCILLHLFQFPIDLSKIAFAKQYSEFLSFVIDPDNYDFSKVDLDNYMWQNLIYSDEYKRFFVEHRELILTDNLKTSLANGLASNNVQKIVYGIFVDTNDLRRYNI